jgi:hypothetical protein
MSSSNWSERLSLTLATMTDASLIDQQMAPVITASLTSLRRKVRSIQIAGLYRPSGRLDPSASRRVVLVRAGASTINSLDDNDDSQSRRPSAELLGNDYGLGGVTSDDVIVHVIDGATHETLVTDASNAEAVAQIINDQLAVVSKSNQD